MRITREEREEYKKDTVIYGHGREEQGPCWQPRVKGKRKEVLRPFAGNSARDGCRDFAANGSDGYLETREWIHPFVLCRVGRERSVSGGNSTW